MSWVPKSESELEDAIKDGTLSKGHFVSFSEEVNPDDLAVTICAMSIDGGIIIVGVKDTTNDNAQTNAISSGSFLAPNKFDGAIDQVYALASNIDPSVAVKVSQIESLVSPTNSYIVVEVSVSDKSPHMVNSRYYRRNSSENVAMNNADVRGYMLRKQRPDPVLELLDSLESTDPVEPQNRKFGHVYLVAQPIFPIDNIALRQLISNDRELRKLIFDADTKCIQEGSNYTPTLSDATKVRQYQDGALLTKQGGTTASEEIYEPTLIQVKILNNGGITVLLGRCTHQGKDHRWVFEGQLIAFVQRLVYMAAKISELTGYSSLWDLGVRATDISGTFASSVVDDSYISYRYDPFDDESYTATAIQPVSRLNVQPNAVTRVLVDDLIRVLGVAHKYTALESEQTY